MEKKVMLMSDYTVYCTSEQTNKALELGAPIRFEMEHPLNFETLEKSPYPDIKVGKDGEPILITPTAEQMRGWLEDNGFYFRINTIGSSVEIDSNCIYEDYCICGTEGILNAIDSALDYLIKNKK